jgi:adenylate cyclase
LRAHNTEKANDEQIHLRIGIHLGDIVQKDSDVFGDGVNIASRLQALAEPDTICISQKVYEEVAKKIDLGAVVSLGQPKLKNIAERFQVYALLLEAPNGFRQKFQVQRLKLFRRVRSAHQLLAVVVLIAATAAVIQYLHPFKEEPPALPLPDKPSIVLRPFANLSPESGQDYFSKGLAFDLTADLSKVSSLFVIASGTAASLTPDEPIAQVGQKLGVRHVLDGSVRRAGDQVRITVQLSDAVEGHLVWSERYDRKLKDLFAVQDEIRHRIVLALKVQLTPEEQERFRHAPTDNLEAYDYYLRGLADYWRFTKEAQAETRRLSEQALAVDPQYAGAYALLGRTYAWEWILQWSQDSQALEKAATLAQQAVTLDESLPAAHQLLGQVYLFQKRHEQAITEAERAVSLAPNDAESYLWLGWILNYAGQSEKSLALIEKAMRLNPRHPPNYSLALGQVYRQLGRYQEAIAALRTAISRNSNLPAAHIALAATYGELGQEAEAKAEGAEVRRLNPHFSLEVYKERWPAKDPVCWSDISQPCVRRG